MKIINLIIWILNWVAGLLLFISYLALYISPETSTLPAFLGLIYPLLLIMNIIFIVWWLFVRWKRLFFSLVIILLGFSHIGRTWQLKGTSIPDKADASQIKVMSYNVQLLGLYNWKENTNIRDSIVGFLADEQPDILCLQEYFFSESSNFETTRLLRKSLNAGNLHQGVAIEAVNKQKFGMASFLNYPIINKGEIQFDSSNNLCIYTDFLWHGDTIRLYNIHLQSIHFNNDDYEDVDKLILSEIDRKKLSRYNNIRKKLAYAFERRANQASEVGQHIENSPYPVIVCGDFNDSPISYAYHQIGKKLDDSFTESGQGLAYSYKRKYLRMRIDHILHSKSLGSFEHKVHEIGFSDHFPVSCFLRKEE
ncbi:MAG: endonuclease/exonuclease/phosphatase family protein [Bacteroidales bacterium]